MAVSLKPCPEKMKCTRSANGACKNRYQKVYGRPLRVLNYCNFLLPWKKKKFLPCNANHDSRFLLIFLQLVDIKEPSVLVESVLWTQYSLQYESNHPCSRSVWQSCVSICYFQIVLQSANKTGCLRRWWGSPSCSSSAPASLPQHYKQRRYVICQRTQHMPLALGEKGEPSPPLVRWKQKFSRNKTK